MSRLAPKAAQLLVCALLLAPLAVTPAPQEQTPLVESQRVTAFDLLVELTRPGKPDRSVEPPADLVPDHFTVLWDGEPLPVVALAPGGVDEEPWRLVVYIDRVLSSNHTIRWAVMELAERARWLADLGEVEIVVAEPEPRRALAPTRDRQLIDDSLSGVFLEPAGTAELILRREEFLIQHPREQPRADSAELARRAGRQERLLLRRQTDRLLGWLVESEPPTSRRAVLLVGDGWDLRPEEFYASPGTAPATRDLGRETAELAETLAAYGWVVAPLAPPPPPVGVGRFGAFVLPDVTFPWLFAVKLRSLEVWLDGNRKPKKAHALTELGHSLRGQGRLDDAVEAYRKAVYHYYDHPKTAKRQAAALVSLGETLELQEKRTEARTAFRTATVFDPSLEPRFPFVAAGLLAPLAPLEQLAHLTTGNVAGDPGALDRLLTSLEQRLRLTAQLPGDPDGGLHRLQVRLLRAGFVHRFPSTARGGTPPAVAELRLRRLLQGELTAGQLELTASPVSASDAPAGPLQIELRLPPGSGTPESAAEARDLVVSWASAGPETSIHYGTRSATIARAGSATLPIDLPTDHLWLALLVEDPASGTWGGSSLELPDD